MMKVLNTNSFSFLTADEDEQYPFAGIYRSTLKQRFVDTFKVFNGRSDLLGYADHIFPGVGELTSHDGFAIEFGVLDYFGFGITRFLSLAFVMALAGMLNSDIRVVYIVPAIAFGLAFFAVLLADFVLRALVSAVLTVVVSPFIALAALGCAIKRAFINKRIDKAAATELTNEGVPADYAEESQRPYSINYIQRNGYELGFYKSANYNENSKSTYRKLVVVKCDTIAADNAAEDKPKTRQVHGFKIFDAPKDSLLCQALSEINEGDFSSRMSRFY